MCVIKKIACTEEEMELERHCIFRTVMCLKGFSRKHFVAPLPKGNMLWVLSVETDFDQDCLTMPVWCPDFRWLLKKSQRVAGVELIIKLRQKNKRYKSVFEQMQKSFSHNKNCLWQGMRWELLLITLMLLLQTSMKLVVTKRRSLCLGSKLREGYMFWQRCEHHSWMGSRVNLYAACLIC